MTELTNSMYQSDSFPIETELKPKDDGGNRRKKHTAQNHYEVGFESLQLQSYLFAEFVMHAV